MLNKDLKSGNTTALAYIGDAVYEVFIRKHVLETFPGSIDDVNRRVIDFVCAEGQNKIARSMLKGFLTDDEEALLKRGRNQTRTGKPRGASPMEYKMASGFETLVGYLYLNDMNERLEEVIAEAIRVIEE